LQGDHETIGGKIVFRQRRRPGRVIGFDADEGDIGRLFLGQALQIGEMHGTDRCRETLRLRHAFQAQAMGLHMLHMGGPGIRHDDIMAGAGEMRPDIAADSAGTNNQNAFIHECVLGLIHGL
jgi:hypothetical protein